jgi:hypothetical protein
MSGDSRTNIINALSKFISVSQAEQGADEWNRAFSDRPMGGVAKFSRVVGNMFDLPSSTCVQIQIEITSALNQAKVAGTDTNHQRIRAVSSSVEPVLQSAPDSDELAAATVAQDLLMALASQIPVSQRSVFLEELRHVVREQADIDFATLGALDRWDCVSDVFLPPKKSMLKGVVHAAYLAACDASGPSHADRALSNAVRSATGSMAARRCDPRSFL